MFAVLCVLCFIAAVTLAVIFVSVFTGTVVSLANMIQNTEPIMFRVYLKNWVAKKATEKTAESRQQKEESAASEFSSLASTAIKS